jgi:hypothetical protein
VLIGYRLMAASSLAATASLCFSSATRNYHHNYLYHRREGVRCVDHRSIATSSDAFCVSASNAILSPYEYHNDHKDMI